MKKRIVILGAGYGGLTTAISLQKKLNLNEADVTLVNTAQQHCLSISLHKLAAGTIPQAKCEVDIRKLLHPIKVKFIKATVDTIDFNQQFIQLKNKQSLAYDYLVIGLGSEPETFGIPGLKEHALFIRSIESAMQIQDHIEQVFYHNKRKMKSHRFLTFVVGGAGFTGIQFTGELVDRIPYLCKKYGISPESVKIYNIEAAADILPGFHPELTAYARKLLEKKGVIFKTGTAIKECHEDHIILSDNEQIETKTLIWTGGVRGNSLQEKLNIETTRGRLVVDEYLKIPNNPNVFVVGDGSLFINKETDRPYPPTAQIAVQQGNVCAKNIISAIRNLPPEPFSPNIKGSLVSLGTKKAAGLLWGRPVKGSTVYLLKKMIDWYYLYTIGGIPLASRNLRIPKLLKLSER